MILRNRMLCVFGAAMLAACNPTTPPSVPSGDTPLLSPTQTSIEIGDYVFHVNALTTDQLTAAIATQYDIVRSESRAMLNVSVLRHNPGGPDRAVNARIVVSAANLAGQVKSMLMRPILEGDAIYYIGEVAISSGETLIFTIDVTPEGATESQTIRFMKQFFID
jgi:hypothetical protein